jgi:cytochrome c biogenesis protein CcdA
VTIQVAASRPAFAALLMLAYAAGHSAVLALAGVAGPYLLGASTRNERTVVVLRRACGAIVLAGGFYLVYAAP